MTPLRWSLVNASGVLLVDQLTKWWAVATLPGNPIVLIDGILDLRYVTNSGVSFSMFQGAGAVIALAVIAIVVFVAILVTKIDTTPEAVALGLVLGERWAISRTGRSVETDGSMVRSWTSSTSRSSPPSTLRIRQ